MDLLATAASDAFTTADATFQTAFEALHQAADAYTVRIGLFNDWSDSLADLLSTNVGGVRVALHLLLNFPLAYMLRKVPSPTLRHLLAVVLGVLTLHFLVDRYWIHPVGLAVVSYLLLRLVPAGPLCNIVVFSVAMTWLSATHYFRMTNMDAPFDVTASMMVLVIKITSITFNLYDAGILRRQKAQTGTTIGGPPFLRSEEGADGHGTADRAKADVVNALTVAAVPGAELAAKAKNDRSEAILHERSKLALDHLPSPLEYMGYSLLFMTVMTGPATSYREYLDSMDGSRLRREKAAAKAAGDQHLSFDGSATKASLVGCGEALLYVALHVVGGMFLPLSAFWTGQALPLGETLPATLVCLYLSMLFERCKFYFVWRMAESACVMAHFGYNGRDAHGQPRWDGINNMDVLHFEQCQSPRDSSVRWNRVTGDWLRRYVFERMPAGPLQLPVLYFISAFWHGFFPGYYLFFLSAAVLQAGVKGVRAHVRPLFLRSPALKRTYDMAGVVVTAITVAYFGSAFVAATMERAWATWGRVYYVGHLIMLPLALFAVLAPAPRHRHHHGHPKQHAAASPVDAPSFHKAKSS